MPGALAHMSFRPISSGPSTPPVQPVRRGKGARGRQTRRRRRETPKYEATKEAAPPTTSANDHNSLLGLPRLAQQSVYSVRSITSTILQKTQVLPQAAAAATVATVAAVGTMVVKPVLSSAGRVKAAASEGIVRATARFPSTTDGQLRLLHSSQIRL